MVDIADVVLAVSWLWLAAIFGLHATLALWTYYDAEARGGNGFEEGLWVLLFPPFLLRYLLRRDRIGAREEPIAGREALVAAACIALMVAFVLGALLSPPDPFSMVLYGTASLPIGVLVGYWLILRGGYGRLKTTLANLRSSSE